MRHVGNCRCTIDGPLGLGLTPAVSAQPELHKANDKAKTVKKMMTAMLTGRCQFVKNTSLLGTFTLTAQFP